MYNILKMKKKGLQSSKMDKIRIDQMPLDASFMECITHGTDAYPLQYYVDELHLYENRETPLHWHHELEFFVVHSGAADVQAGTSHYHLGTAEGIFINSNVFHSFRQTGTAEVCNCPNIVFSEELLSYAGSVIGDKYVKPVLLNQNLPCIPLRQEVPWQKSVLRYLTRIFSLLQTYGGDGAYAHPPRLSFSDDNTGSSSYELEIQILLTVIWKDIYEHRLEEEQHTSLPVDPTLQIRMQKMLQFIQSHYRNPVSLEDIARSANISKSECNRNFHYLFNNTPMEYLSDYRIKKAKQSLRSSNETLEQIAIENGFSSAAYFCRVFKRKTGMTAMEYRKIPKQKEIETCIEK